MTTPRPQRHPTDGEGHAATPARNIDDGGPAFPTFGIEGMPLRDYFAGLAMQATMAGCQERDSNRLPNLNYHAVAIDSYKQADAMLAARKAGGR